jgi:hypothetical protein
MKRIGMFVSCLFLLISSPVVLPAAPVAGETSFNACTELPWATVDAVLKQVDELRAEYTYSQLVEWYSDAMLTVDQVGTDVYQVTISDETGILDVVIIDMA